MFAEISRKIKKSLGISWSSYKSAKERTLKSILEHSQNSNQNQNIKAATKQLILDFYNRDDISKVLPYKSKTVKIKTIDNTSQRKSIRIMELSPLKAFHQFKTEHPEFKVGKSTSQLLRPKNIRLKAAAKRLVCCCTYHQNIDYLRKTITRVLKFNKENSDLFTSNENLCSFVLCDNNSMLCINQKCEDCKDFPKLTQYNADFKMQKFKMQ